MVGELCSEQHWGSKAQCSISNISCRAAASSNAALPKQTPEERRQEQHLTLQHTCTVVMAARSSWGSQDAGESSSLPFLLALSVFLHALLNARYDYSKVRDIEQ